MTKKIYLQGKNGQGKFTLVSDKDYERLNQWRWNISSVGYVSRNRYINKISVKILMHREIMNTPDGLYTDHINHNKLDNRRENLRVCTPTQNAMNSSTRNRNKLGIKGVVWQADRNKFAVYAKVNGKSRFFGRFESLQDAANKYNEIALKYFGRFAKINTDDEIQQAMLQMIGA